MDNDQKRYVAVVRLKSDTELDRLKGVVPQINDLFSRFSDGEMESAFRSNDGLLFGFFFKANVPGQIMRAEFEKLTAVHNEDALMVFEAGPLCTGTGFSRAWTWLQHH